MAALADKLLGALRDLGLILWILLQPYDVDGPRLMRDGAHVFFCISARSLGLVCSVKA